MVNLRDNLGWFVVLIAIGVSAITSLAFQSDIFLNLVSVLVGFLASYLLLVKEQKRTWKREYAVRIAEEVYGSLFKQLKWIIWFLENKEIIQLSFESWGQIQEDHRYFMVEEKLRTRFDDFFQRVRNHSDAVYKLRNKTLPRIINEIGKSVFKTDVEKISPLITYKDEGSVNRSKVDLVECLVSEIHPKDYVLKKHREREILEFKVLFGEVEASAAATKRFDEFWHICLEKMKEDRTYKFIIEENERMFREATRLKKEVTDLIEKPWKI